MIRFHEKAAPCQDRPATGTGIHIGQLQTVVLEVAGEAGVTPRKPSETGPVLIVTFEEASLPAAAGQVAFQPANADVVCQCVVLVAWIDDRDAIERQEFASTGE